MKIRCKEGELLLIEEEVLKRSVMLKNLLENTITNEDEDIIDLNFTKSILEMVFKYACEIDNHEGECLACREYFNGKRDTQHYFDEINDDLLVEILACVSFLDIDYLENTICKTIAERIQYGNFDMKKYI
jgi:hypothetical protein